MDEERYLETKGDEKDVEKVAAVGTFVDHIQSYDIKIAFGRRWGADRCLKAVHCSAKHLHVRASPESRIIAKDHQCLHGLEDLPHIAAIYLKHSYRRYLPLGMLSIHYQGGTTP